MNNFDFEEQWSWFRDTNTRCSSKIFIERTIHQVIACALCRQLGALRRRRWPSQRRRGRRRRKTGLLTVLRATWIMSLLVAPSAATLHTYSNYVKLAPVALWLREWDNFFFLLLYTSVICFFFSSGFHIFSTLFSCLFLPPHRNILFFSFFHYLSSLVSWQSRCKNRDVAAARGVHDV